MKVTSDSVPLNERTVGMVSFPPLDADYVKWGNLGSVCGGMGAVWAARHKPSNENVALKIYNLDKCGEELELIEHEINTVRQLRHPNILPYLASFISNQQLWVVMPLMGYTSAAHFAASSFPDGLPEIAICFIIRDVLKALHYLHNKGIIHRAIKGTHIQISSDGTCYLSGLRHSVTRVSQGKWFNVVHSYPPQAKYFLNWLSPEVLEQDLLGYTEKSDLYSVGIVICELANGEVPFSRETEATYMFLDKYEGIQPFIYDASTYRELYQNGEVYDDGSFGGSTEEHFKNLATQRKFSPSAHQFVKLLLSRKPSDRTSACQLLQHSFIKQCRKSHTTLKHYLQNICPITHEPNTGDNCIPDLLEDCTDRLSISEDLNWEF